MNAHILYLAGGMQVFVAFLNLFLSRILNWKEDIARMPLLLREVHTVHSWFISIILLIFASMTLGYHHEIVEGKNQPLQTLMLLIGTFWSFRALLQVFYYSSSHWKGRPVRTLIHIGCMVVYGGMGFVYLTTGMKGGIH